MRSYQFRNQFKIYIGSYQEFRFNNWSWFIVTRIIINIYIIKKNDPIHINNSNIYNISHAYKKIIHSPDSKANGTQKQIPKEFPINVPHVEYQDYLNTKEIYSKTTRKEHTTYLIHLTTGLFHNFICFWTKLVIFPKNPKIKRFS
jgi:hypothetical protein